MLLKIILSLPGRLYTAWEKYEERKARTNKKKSQAEKKLSEEVPSSNLSAEVYRRIEEDREVREREYRRLYLEHQCAYERESLGYPRDSFRDRMDAYSAQSWNMTFYSNPIVISSDPCLETEKDNSSDSQLELEAKPPDPYISLKLEQEE